MKKIVSGLAILAVAGIAGAANVPSGLTGLWLFNQSGATEVNGTIGGNLDIYEGPPSYAGDAGNGTWFTGPWTDIGTDSNPTLYSGNGVVQDRTYDYITVPSGLTANGGGSYVNDYTIMLDYEQTQAGAYNALYQTSANPYDNPGDLYITGGAAGSTIGNADVGYSSMTFDASQWHRIVLSVDNSSFFKVYVDGTLYVDGTAQGVDGQYSLYENYFYLFNDSDPWGKTHWGLLGTVAVWDHALTGSEVAAMGGWIGSASTPTALTMVPEPATMSFMAFGVLALALLRKNRK